MSSTHNRPIFYFIFCLCLCFTACQHSGTTKKANPDQEEWQAIFNGQDLNGWTAKFSGFDLAENYNNTFQVEDSLLRVSYADYDSFRNEFGHLFYEKAFSYYKIRTSYRFLTKTIPNAPSWAYANNGLMLHSQSAESMTKNQDFPLSIEFQFLGGKGAGIGDRPTGNLCTPACHVTMNDTLFTPHCVSSTSNTYHGEQWVTAEAIVLGDSIIHHIIEGDTVITYSKPVIGGDLGGLDTLKFVTGTPMTSGYITIQAESHPTDFKKIEVLDFCGCMDKKALNYKSYYVKHVPKNCRYE